MAHVYYKTGIANAVINAVFALVSSDWWKKLASISPFAFECRKKRKTRPSLNPKMTRNVRRNLQQMLKVARNAKHKPQQPSKVEINT